MPQPGLVRTGLRHPATMPVEFIGQVATRHGSEIHPPSGPAIDPEFLYRFVGVARGGRLRQGAGRAQLVGSRRAAGRRLRRGAHALARLPRRAPARLHGAHPRGPGLRHPRPVLRRAGRDAHDLRRQRRRPGPRRRPRRQGRALPAHRRVPRGRQAHLDRRGALRPPRRVLRGQRRRTPPRARCSSPGSRSTSAAPRPTPTGWAASTPTCSRSGASRWRRPPSRSPRCTRPREPRAARRCPASASRSGPSWGPPRTRRGRARTTSSTASSRTTAAGAPSPGAAPTAGATRPPAPTSGRSA